MLQSYLKKKDSWPKKVIGLTGIIASGKSTTARLISQMGITVLDADELAKDAVRPGTQALQRLVNTLGTGILKQNGDLDRARVLGLILSDAGIKQTVENIIHPEILKLMDERLKALKAKGVEMVFVEVPLLFEAGWEGLFDMIVTVSAPEKACIKRLIERNNIGRRKAIMWLKQQLPQGEKIRRSDYVIFNDFQENLQKQVAKLIDDISRTP
ncbi:MAG: dephospho-CoA kinase [Dissulfurimicrobium sp.]|uniref:dephospho-CoA kinase n=1 Tax=Dissulfurimicrobium TaxID=1769732 RepID=UPI001EDBDBFF|nr:dephospho-CoA kinase [Dissulfurimicrobium hydrothermale]UKL13359.1 dephospho-CoA kinase [Dissulfurimicrobium hydrothermale]